MHRSMGWAVLPPAVLGNTSRSRAEPSRVHLESSHGSDTWAWSCVSGGTPGQEGEMKVSLLCSLPERQVWSCAVCAFPTSLLH